MKISLSKVSWLRTSQGAIVPAKNSEASITPASDRLFLFQRRCQAHKPDAGRNESREVLVSTATPQSRPKAIHGFAPSISSSFRVSQKMTARSRAVTLVSQTHRVHQYITDGSSDHDQAVQIATFSQKHFRAIRKMGTHVK